MTVRQEGLTVLAVVSVVTVGLWFLIRSVDREEHAAERRYCQYVFGAAATRRDTIDLAYITRCQRHMLLGEDK